MKRLQKRPKTKHVVIAICVIALIAVCTTLTISRESFQRHVKDLKSDFSGGIQRTVTVYDYNGKVLRTYTGKFDIDDNKESGTTKFDLDGKRKIIKGGIVIIEEE